MLAPAELTVVNDEWTFQGRFEESRRTCQSPTCLDRLPCDNGGAYPASPPVSPVQHSHSSPERALFTGQPRSDVHIHKSPDLAAIRSVRERDRTIMWVLTMVQIGMYRQSITFMHITRNDDETVRMQPVSVPFQDPLSTPHTHAEVLD
jgi:hypothetical protein